MSDEQLVATNEELVKRLRAVDHLDIEDCFMQSPLYAYAADRIETLERDKKFILEERDRTFALMLERNEALTAERDEWKARSREVLTAGLEIKAKLEKAVEALSECLERNALLEARLGKAVRTMREAVTTWEQPHYGDMDTAVDHGSEAIDLIRATLAEIELVSKEGEKT
jgi:hypothetical protein